MKYVLYVKFKDRPLRTFIGRFSTMEDAEAASSRFIFDDDVVYTSVIPVKGDNMEPRL